MEVSQEIMFLLAVPRMETAKVEIACQGAQIVGIVLLDAGVRVLN